MGMEHARLHWSAYSGQVSDEEQSSSLCVGEWRRQLQRHSYYMLVTETRQDETRDISVGVEHSPGRRGHNSSSDCERRLVGK